MNLLLLLPLLAAAQFVPTDFQVPKPFANASFKLVPLGPDVAQLDYNAYMGSMQHIRQTMGGTWPRPGLTMADQAKDMAGEQAQWDARKSFPYAILTPDGKKELGCFYLRPSKKPEHDVIVSFWTTESTHNSGQDKIIFEELKTWTTEKWPFKNIAWPTGTTRP